MAILKKEKALVREFVRINFINDISSYPDFEASEERYLLPVLGASLYALVKGLADDDTIIEAPTAEQLQNTELLRRCRAVVVPTAYLLDMAISHVQMTDSGLRTISTDNMPAAHRWEYNELKEYLSDKGSFAIESLIRFLFLHKDYYTEWTESSEFKEINSFVFKTGEEFAKYFSTRQPHRLFWELRPLIREVEDFYIASQIGSPFLQELKSLQAPSALEAQAIELIKKSVAQTVIVKAVEKLAVKITDKGFVVMLSSTNSDAANSGDLSARDPQLSLLYQSCERSGDAYLLQLQEHLDKHASALIFKTYYESAHYTKAVTDVPLSKNANRKIFGF